MPFVFSKLATHTTSVQIPKTCSSKVPAVHQNYAQRVAKPQMVMSFLQKEEVSQQKHLNVVSATTSIDQNPTKFGSQNNYMVGSAKPPSQSVLQKAPAYLAQTKSEQYHQHAQNKMRAFLQRRQPQNFVIPKAETVVENPPVKVDLPIADMKLAPIKIDDDYMQHYMDATAKIETNSHSAVTSSSFFDKKVFVNIMNFAKVQDCIFTMQMFDKLLQRKIENQLDYSILLDSETVGVEKRLQGFEVDGVRYPVTFGGSAYEAKAYDFPVPSSETGHQRTVRMWKPEAVSAHQDHFKGDSLESQYFVISASLQDLMVRYLASETTFEKFKKNVIFEFDEYLKSVIAQMELVRLLWEDHDFEIDEAIEVTKSCFKVNPAPNEESDVILNEIVSKLPMHPQIVQKLTKPQAFQEDKLMVADTIGESLIKERLDIKIEQMPKVLTTSEV